MSLYHASFKGRKIGAHPQPLRRIKAVVESDSIYNVEDVVKGRYHSVTGLYVTNCEWFGGNMFEIAS